jgi:hypothetical protein
VSRRRTWVDGRAPVACSECPKRIGQAPTANGGRPRKTCGEVCALKRQRRLAGEALFADQAEATRWWLALHEDQRTAAMAWARENPPDASWRGGRQLWAYFNRAAFSCERVVVSGVR